MATATGSIDDERSEKTHKAEQRKQPFGGGFGDGEPVACPYCKSMLTECVAMFGPVRLTAQHYCRECHSAFEVVKD